RRLAGEKVEKDIPEVERVFLTEPEEVDEPVERVFLTEDEEPEKETEVPTEEPTVSTEDFSFTSDMLSPFEIEELQKELQQKGVPPSEIDIIIKQAKELPRDLIEELVRSLDAERLRK
ncbi:MAG: hypothetical protein ACFFE3_11355, partial [Candidatus Thorarchaeota archaeon]